MVILSNTSFVPTITFKADDSFYEKLKMISRKKGISVSAYIKLNLSEVLNKDMTELTENGLTIERERQILKALNDGEGKVYEDLQDFFDDLN